MPPATRGRHSSFRSPHAGEGGCAEPRAASGCRAGRPDRGVRYRLAFRNHTDDPHPLHLHRNTFELTNVEGRPTAGVRKDVVLIRPFGRIDADFVAAGPGLTLFHCHQQLHMDFGFMKLFEVV